MRKVRLEVLAAPALGFLTLLVLSGFTTAPAASPGHDGVAVELPGEGCTDVAYAPGTTAGPQPSCEADGTVAGVPPGAGGLWSVVGPLAAVVVGAIGLALAATVVVIARGARGQPAPAGEWWICTTCGMSNLADIPRCYKCRAWRPAQAPDVRPRVTTEP